MSVRISDAALTAAVPPGGFFGSWLVRRLRSDPLGLLGLSLVLAVVFCGLTADWITPYDPLKINVPEKLSEPSFQHLLGTDNLGRDIFSRVIKGSQIALIVGVLSILLAQVFGLTIGLIAGYAPRAMDNAILLAGDTIYSFPTVMMALTGVTLFGANLVTIMAVVVASYTPVYARMVRTATLSAMNSEYVLAERSLGASPPRILGRHIVPNIIGPLFVLGSMDIPSVITLEAGLSFLGLGIPPPAPSWGRILDDGYKLIREAPWIVVAGGIPLIITTLGFTFLGEALRDMLDPKLRRVV